MSERSDEEDILDPDGVTVNDVEWETLQDDQITQDERTKSRYKPRLTRLPDSKRRTPMDFFLYLFPNYIPQIVANTNKGGKARRANWKMTTNGEILCFIGILIAKCKHKHGSRKGLWSVVADGPYPPPMFGRFMSRRRFDQLYRFFTFEDPTVQREDGWFPIRGFIDAFNKNRAATVSPGWITVVDESMMKWKGEGLPHLSFVPRKPEPLGCEVKNLLDVISGIMLHLEICEAKEDMGTKKWCDKYPKSSATTLRICESLKDQGVLVCGDSWFTSATTAVAMRKELKIHFTGNVKTAYRKFPRAYLRALLPDEEGDRGKHVVAKAKISGVDLIAVGWNNHHLITYVSTCGVTTPGTQYGVRRSWGKKWFDRPDLVEKYMFAAPGIDQHNRDRQSTLGLEYAWDTDNCWARMYHCLIGITVVDAWRAYRYFREGGGERHTSIIDFYMELSDQLIHNKWGGAIQEEKKEAPVSALGDLEDFTGHPIVKMKTQRTCVKCSRVNNARSLTYWKCTKCDIYLCRDGQGGRQCWSYHLDFDLPEKRYKKRRRSSVSRHNERDDR